MRTLLNPVRDWMSVMAAGFLFMGFSVAMAVAEDALLSDPGQPTSRPRVRFDPNNNAEIDIRRRLITAVEAANAEDLDGFVDCFVGGVQAKIRTPAAIRFAQHDVSMELVDSHIVKAGKTTGEVAVRYRVILSDDRFDVVSLVEMKQERGYWRINSEKIQSNEHQSPSMCSPSRYACLGATCRFAAR